MSHLSVKINNHYLTVPEDFSVDFEDVNPLWNDYESFAADIELPVEPNRAVLTDVDTVQSDTRLSSIDGQPMQLIIDGIPFRSGKAQTQEGESITDTVMLSMSQTSETLDDIVANLNCREVPVKDKIKIGESVDSVAIDVFYKRIIGISATGEKIVSCNVNTGFSLSNDNTLIETPHDNADIILPAITFSTPKTFDDDGNLLESYINTSLDYTGKPYCNAKVCYSHYKKNGETLETEGTYDPFFVLDADRPLSGICFYLLYFLDCLFYHLGFKYDNSNITAVGDMNKLCFFTTHCKYDKEHDRFISGVKEIKDWLKKRNVDYDGALRLINKNGYLESVTGNMRIDALGILGNTTIKVGDITPSGHRIISLFNSVGIKDSIFLFEIVNMYANSDNFPDMTVKNVIDSLWAGWGIKFIVDYEDNRVTPVFIRDVFRDQSEPINLNVELISVTCIEEKKGGVIIKYSNESDPEEQSQKIKTGKRDYDTDYDYTDYRSVITNKDYLNILKTQSYIDTTCYITPNTGNAYRIKVNKEAKDSGEFHPTAFEVGGYKGVEIGDCTNKDYVEKLVVNFSPALMTDVNGKNERKISNTSISERKQNLAVFVDENMLNENQSVYLDFPLYGDIGCDYRIYFTSDERYDPSSTEDGNSPLQHHDWGAAICMMRGGGADMQIQKYDYNYDGCGNYKWRTTAGDYTMNPDSIDNWGNDYDYNGTSSGIGDDERFSLKIQAYKEVNGQILCNADEVDEDGNITRKVRSRGLKDTFMSEYIHWLMNRKLVELKFRCEAAQLVGIQWDKRYRIGEYVFFWNKLNYTATAKDGIGVVTAQVYI